MLTSSQLNCDVEVHPKPRRAERVTLRLKGDKSHNGEERGDMAHL